MKAVVVVCFGLGVGGEKAKACNASLTSSRHIQSCDFSTKT